MQTRPSTSLSQGFALCTAEGTLLGHTYRATADDAVASVFALNEPMGAKLWAERQALGWSVQQVYARIFSPKFYVDSIPEEREVA